MLERISQEDFSAGMFPAVASERIPSNGCEDITNGVLDETGAVYRRGGGLVILGAGFVTGRPRALWAGYLGGAQRELVFTNSDLYSDTGLTHIGAFSGMSSRPRLVAVLNDVMYLPGGASFDGTALATPFTAVNPTHVAAVANRLLFGKDDKLSFSVLTHTGTGSLTVGSPSVTSVVTTSGSFQIGQTIVGAGIPLGTTITNVVGATITLSANATAAGTAVPLIATGGTPKFDATDFHRFPAGTQITGIVPLRDRAAVFTTQGLWLVSGLALNLTDADGNVQQRVDQYSPNLWLWNDTPAAVAAYGESLIVPGVDGVWMLSLGVASEAPQPQQLISRPIGNLYRQYFTAGYTPGQATVFANHYLLPILNGNVVVDVLVCRLDATDARGNRIFPWTHFSGSLLPAAFNPAPFSGSSWGNGMFLHALMAGAAVTTIVGGCEYFGPDPQGTRNLTDPDGSTHELDLKTRTFETGPNNENTVVSLRVRRKMTSGAGTSTLTASVAPGPTSVFTALAGAAPEDPEGVDPYSFKVAKRARLVRFRLRSGTTVAQDDVTVRGLEVRVRQSGRQ